MNFRAALPLLFSALALAGCSTFDRQDLSMVRARGVSSRVVSKLEDGRPLEPRDVVELSRRGVPDRLIIRQLDVWGLRTPIGRRDEAALRKAGVHPDVIDAMRRASDYYMGHYGGARYYGEPFDVGDPYYDYPYYYGPGLYNRVYPYGWDGGLGITYGGPRYYYHHRHW